MKAAQINRYGGPDTVAVTPAVSRPVPAEGQVLVEVHAASLNPIDTIVRSGVMRQQFGVEFPATLGGDFAGTVAEVGPDARSLAVGDEVYGHASVLIGGTGTLAELVAANTGATARKPRSTTFTEAASLSLVGASAIQAIIDHLDVQRGQRILILGAAGGIGSLAVQLAKHRGAYVIGTAFSDDIAYVRSLGADEVIDAKAQAFEQVVRDADGVFDTVGGDANAKSYGVLRRGGILVSMLAPADEARAASAGITVISQLTDPTTERLEKLAALIDEGILMPHVDRVFPLEEVAAAFAYRETSHPRGKVVVTIRAEP